LQVFGATSKGADKPQAERRALRYKPTSPNLNDAIAGLKGGFDPRLQAPEFCE
jgi:hypothetical protein